MTDRLSPIWPFPHDRCGRTEGCVCLVDPAEVATARVRVARRHRESVRAAATSTIQRGAAA